MSVISNRINPDQKSLTGSKVTASDAKMQKTEMDFYKMLFASLKNQIPGDDNQNAQDITNTMVGIEQAKTGFKLTSHMEKLTDRLKNQDFHNATQLSGKEVKYSTDKQTFKQSNGFLKFNYKLEHTNPFDHLKMLPTNVGVTIVVSDINGKHILRKKLIAQLGSESFTWDGITDDDTLAADGQYKLSVTTDDPQIKVLTSSQGRVVRVERDSDDISYVCLDNGDKIETSFVAGIVEGHSLPLSEYSSLIGKAVTSSPKAKITGGILSVEYLNNSTNYGNSIVEVLDKENKVIGIAISQPRGIGVQGFSSNVYTTNEYEKVISSTNPDLDFQLLPDGEYKYRIFVQERDTNNLVNVTGNLHLINSVDNSGGMPTFITSHGNKISMDDIENISAPPLEPVNDLYSASNMIGKTLDYLRKIYPEDFSAPIMHLKAPLLDVEPSQDTYFADSKLVVADLEGNPVYTTVSHNGYTEIPEYDQLSQESQHKVRQNFAQQYGENFENFNNAEENKTRIHKYIAKEFRSGNLITAATDHLEEGPKNKVKERNQYIIFDWDKKLENGALLPQGQYLYSIYLELKNKNNDETLKWLPIVPQNKVNKVNFINGQAVFGLDNGDNVDSGMVLGVVSG